MSNRIDSLQVLRALAALLVVLNHVWGGATHAEAPGSLAHWAGAHYAGGLGVDIFFCLSGFIMVESLRDAPRRTTLAAGFLWRRVRRIYPTYLACLGAMLLFATAPRILGWPGVGYAIDLAPLDLLRNVLLLPSLPGDTASKMAIPPAWTLVYEMCFYALFAACLFAGGRRRVEWLLPVALAACILLVRYGIGQDVRNGWTNIGYIAGDTLCLNFAIGCLVASARRHVSWRVRTQWSLALAGFICLGLFWAAMYVLSGPRLVKFGLPSLILMAIASVCVLGRGWPIRVLVYLGEASYAIYLTHVFVAIPAPSIAAVLPIPADVSGLVLSALAVILGCAFHGAVERPLDKVMQKLEVSFRRLIPFARGRLDGLGAARSPESSRGG